MLMVAVRIKIFNVSANVGGKNLACAVRERQDLVPAKFNRARLMNRNVPAVRRNDALKTFQHRADNNRVCLCAADQKINLGVGSLASRTNFSPRRFAELVIAVTRRL